MTITEAQALSRGDKVRTISMAPHRPNVTEAQRERERTFTVTKVIVHKGVYRVCTTVGQLLKPADIERLPDPEPPRFDGGLTPEGRLVASLLDQSEGRVYHTQP